MPVFIPPEPIVSAINPHGCPFSSTHFPSRTATMLTALSSNQYVTLPPDARWEEMRDWMSLSPEFVPPNPPLVDVPAL